MLQKAFVKATSGRQCLICKNQIPHAYYQRHRDECKLDESDDDIIFIEEILTENFSVNKVQKIESTQVLEPVDNFSQFNTSEINSHSRSSISPSQEKKVKIKGNYCNKKAKCSDEIIILENNQQNIVNNYEGECMGRIFY